MVRVPGSLHISMVSVKQLEDNYHSLKDSAGSELSKSSGAALRGKLLDIKIPIYQFGRQSTKGNTAFGGVSCATEQQSLLDTLLLAQWEDRAWKDLLRYDVTACETKVIEGRRKFVAQLNEVWKAKYFTDLEAKIFQLKEELLFCIAIGDKTNSELIPSGTVPHDANLVIINTNPVEYGHIFLLPCFLRQLPHMQYAKSLEMVTKFAVEIKNCSFRAFYDSAAYSGFNPQYFQACYFSNPLPVELVPVVTISGVWQERGVNICEVVDYPIRTILFEGKEDLQTLVKLVSEISCCLQNQNVPFNILLSDSGTKIYLFSLVHESVPSLSAWECGGQFVLNTRRDFDQATEESFVKLLSVVSLDENGFLAVKQLSCSIASKLDS